MFVREELGALIKQMHELSQSMGWTPSLPANATLKRFPLSAQGHGPAVRHCRLAPRCRCSAHRADIRLRATRSRSPAHRTGQLRGGFGRQANLMSQCDPGAMASLSLVACRRQSRPSPHQCGTGVLQRMMRARSSAAGLWMIVPEPAFAELLERFDGLGSRTRDGRDQRIGKRENGSRRIRQDGVARRRKKRHVRNRR